MIFGIGLSKTGTTSLFAALDLLGYRSATYRHFRTRGVDAWLAGDFSGDPLVGYEAATDLPLATLYPQVDVRYPDSKFILTVRDIDSWIVSAREHFSREARSSFGRDVRLATFGMTGFHEGRFRQVYETHVSGVKAYFKSRSNSLLTLDVVAGDGWGPLCAFLDQPVPDTPFPNVSPGYLLPNEQPMTPTTGA